MECCEKLREDFNNLEKRVLAIETANKLVENNANKTIELEIHLPEADIEGLRFNAQTVKGVFELNEGVYYSKDILFSSARNLKDDTNYDLLSEYLDSPKVRGAFLIALNHADIDKHSPLIGRDLKDIKITLPKENQGAKKYNGANWWYWLLGKSSSSFCHVNSRGSSYPNSASAVGGVAPAFRVERHE
jgi:hypothetical protein